MEPKNAIFVIARQIDLLASTDDFAALTCFLCLSSAFKLARTSSPPSDPPYERYHLHPKLGSESSCPFTSPLNKVLQKLERHFQPRIRNKTTMKLASNTDSNAVFRLPR